MLINNVTKEKAELSPDDFTIAGKCCGSAPVKVVLTWSDPFSQWLTAFFFWELWQDHSDFYEENIIN